MNNKTPETDEITEIYTVIASDPWDYFGEVAYGTSLEIAQSLANEHCQKRYSLSIPHWEFNEKDKSWVGIVKTPKQHDKEYVVAYEIIRDPLNKLISGG